jgi:nucleoid-associated protein YgaU
MGSIRRFAVLLLIVAALSFLAGSALVGKPAVRAAEPLTYVEVEIRDGDTLWQIAAEYKGERQDIRRLIYDICRINNIEAGSIQAGRMILVPVRK